MPTNPKTKLDVQFLAFAETVLPKQSDRKRSREIGEHENFFSRVRTGIQSAPPHVWDRLNALADAKGITGPVAPAEDAGSLGQLLLAAGETIALLKSQLVDKERIIQLQAAALASK